MPAHLPVIVIFLKALLFLLKPNRFSYEPVYTCSANLKQIQPDADCKWP